jgi:hypothetical protein
VQRWIDYDNDGWLDIISAGLIDSIWVDTTILHRNNGNGTFTTVPTNIPSFEGNDLQVYDYDHDSLPDLFVTGRTPVFINAFTALFHNTGNGNFTMDTASFRQLWTGTAKWGDLENDGDADILVDGIMNDNSFFTEIYLNDGAGNFTVQVNNLPGSGEPGTVDWADMDDDGDLDVLIGGTYLMRNDSNGVFTDVSPWFTGAFYLPAIFNDYDNDGDEDIFLLNYFGNDESTILRNDLLTGIPILQNKPTFSIFPNPVKSKATIKSGNEDIIYNLYSPDSRFIRSFIGKNTFQIDISGISSGVYFLTDESKKSFIRIVIE